MTRALVLPWIAVLIGSSLTGCSLITKPATATDSPPPVATTRTPSVPQSPQAEAPAPAAKGETQGAGTGVAASPQGSPQAQSPKGKPAGTGNTPATASRPAAQGGANPPVSQPKAAAKSESRGAQREVSVTMPDGEETPSAGAFRTKYATFAPTAFHALPDWSADEMREAWRAFLRGCRRAASRPLWAETCARARDLKPVDSAAIRSFLEQEFTAYRVQDTTGADGGLITGYYEPLLAGSRERTERFRYPVYAVPADMVHLEARRIPKEIKSRPVFARVEGRKVIPVPAATEPAPGLYELKLGGTRADVRDKRLRLRVEGDRIVPYYSRAQIETRELQSARVLAWVDNPRMLYTMHLQGIGKITLPDGQVVRLAYADQNGHPFRSKVKLSKTARTATVKASAKVVTRGGPSADDAVAFDGIADDDSAAEYAAVDDEYMLEVRGVEVREVRAESQAQALSAVAAAPKPRVAPVNDPSFVFFREVPDGPDGPVGALGVPLTPGRSVAVDPRITPLGAPVFLSTQSPDSGGLLNRLVVAQDTGGAIRGPLRADYFFGGGPTAGTLAHRMKEEGRMWLLLPRSFQPSANMQVAVRGEAKAECIVADDETCVEGSADAVFPDAQ